MEKLLFPYTRCELEKEKKGKGNLHRLERDTIAEFGMVYIYIMGDEIRLGGTHKIERRERCQDCWRWFFTIEVELIGGCFFTHKSAATKGTEARFIASKRSGIEGFQGCKLTALGSRFSSIVQAQLHGNFDWFSGLQKIRFGVVLAAANASKTTVAVAFLSANEIKQTQPSWGLNSKHYRL
ncbi:hypothetical protein L6452_11884 [Arctium lappa]|uniref:Uncharacterized protein n=1 Tax=Arctium lappa TaxID=4217 RepID=A0ACB9DQF1_ARCLA|nr:hypothetical protein L6452_11884 [Arctium lappa]